MTTSAVLIVDDDPDLCHLLGGILRMRNLMVGVAPNLQLAEECMREIKPSLIFLDHNLPDGTGIDFIPRIEAYNENIRVVVMTADSTPDIDLRAYEMGADQFLVKPFNHAIIHDIVDNMLTGQELS